MSGQSIFRVGEQLPFSPGEIFHRSPDGRFLPRSGFVNSLISHIGIKYVNHTTVCFDPAPIIQALRELAQDTRVESLMNSYSTLTLHYEDYCETIDSKYLGDISLEAKQTAPKFSDALQRQLDIIDLNILFELEKKTEPLDAICDAYVKVLTLHFFAKTTLHPQTKSNRYSLQPYILNAIEMLRLKLQSTLLPNGEPKDSLLLSAFLETGNNNFEHYAYYDRRFDSIQGTQEFIQLANRNPSYEQSIFFERPSVNKQNKNFANQLIKLIQRFQILAQATSFIEAVDEDNMLPALLADLSRPLD